MFILVPRVIYRKVYQVKTIYEILKCGVFKLNGILCIMLYFFSIFDLNFKLSFYKYCLKITTYF